MGCWATILVSIAVRKAVAQDYFCWLIVYWRCPPRPRARPVHSLYAPKCAGYCRVTNWGFFFVPRWSRTGSGWCPKAQHRDCWTGVCSCVFRNRWHFQDPFLIQFRHWYCAASLKYWPGTQRPQNLFLQSCWWSRSYRSCNSCSHRRHSAQKCPSQTHQRHCQPYLVLQSLLSSINVSWQSPSSLTRNWMMNLNLHSLPWLLQ